MAGVGLVRHRLRLGRYRAIGARTGLAVVPKIINSSELRGRFRNRELVMAICARRRQTFRKRWTRVTVDVANPEHIGLHIWRQDLVDNMIMSLGGTDVLVGHAAFDAHFVIKSRDEHAVAKMFQNAELRRLLVSADIDSAELLSSKLHAYYAREERNPEHAHLLFTAVTTLADAIDALEANYIPEIIRVDR